MHAHLWHLPDGTGLHAPFGELAVEEGTGRLCCHLCGRWYVSLGAHVRVHGHTADSYRRLMGLCTGQPPVAQELSSTIAVRQTLAYRSDEQVRRRLSEVAPLRVTGELAARARAARQRPEPPQRVARRQAALDAGRRTMATRRREELADRLADTGYDDLGDYLRAAYADGASLEDLARATGLGRARLRTDLLAAEVPVRASGHNTLHGRRSRARAAEEEVARRVGTEDLLGWLRERRAAGWSLEQLGHRVGHSGHWVRWRLQGDERQSG
jgi:hypothetical protein